MQSFSWIGSPSREVQCSRKLRIITADGMVDGRFGYTGFGRCHLLTADNTFCPPGGWLAKEPAYVVLEP